MSELLPCPFCGGEAILDARIFDETFAYVIFCVDCAKDEIQTGIGGFDKEKIIEKWNMRRSYD